MDIINQNTQEDIKEVILENIYEQLVEEFGQWDQDEVNYVDQLPDNFQPNTNCTNCCFYEPNGSCQIVTGSINSNGTCNLFIGNEDCNQCIDDDSEAYSLSQSIIDLQSDEDFFYILSLLKDLNLPNYKFETLLENLASDLFNKEEKLSSSKSVSLTKEDKDPINGGLTQKGRDKLNKAEGSNLKPGVKGKATTPEELRRKGSFLRRFYGKDNIPPLKLPNGKPSRFALAAVAWGESVPTSNKAVKVLADKGETLLKRYAQIKEKSKNKKQKLSQNIELDSIQELPICLSNGMVKIPIAKIGSWFHDQHGIVSFTKQDFNQIKEESNKEVLGFTPYITYGHPTNLGYNTVDAELKKGDLIGWEESDDILFGLFDAKEDVISLITNGDYEYSSGEFIRNYKDKFTGDKKGTVLMRVALTNSPFIPFGDAKVEALSSNANNSLPSTIPFVIKLSTDSVISQELTSEDLIINKIEESLNMPPETNIETPVAEQLAPVVSEEVIAPEVKPVYAIKDEPVTPAPIVQAPSLDINELIKTVTSNLSDNFKAQLSAIKAESDNVVASLKTQVESLSNQLTSQQEVTQAFSNSLAQKNRQSFYKGLAEQGVTPVLIQKFSTIEAALGNGQKVIKLSNSAGETVDKEVLDAIAELLVEATLSEPISVQQFGQSMSVPQVNAMQADMQKLIERNKALAQQKKIN